MRSSLLLLVLLPALVVAAPKKKKKAPPPPPPPVTAPTPGVTENLSDSVLAILTGGEQVQVYRASDSGGLRPDPATAIGSDFVRGAGGAALGPAELEALRSVLYDEKSYRFAQDVSRCRFVPQVSFQARAGIDTVDALVSFSCNEVLFLLGKPGGRWVPKGRFDVKPARAKLLALVRQLFPQDREVQQLR
jgi:hypothetical protein